MDKDLDLNTSGALPDRTAASQSGGFGASSAELRTGIKKIDVADTPMYVEDTNSPRVEGDTQKRVPDMVGGFLGRPNGWQR